MTRSVLQLIMLCCKGIELSTKNRGAAVLSKLGQLVCIVIERELEGGLSIF